MNEMMVKKDILAPEGYFEELKERLSALPYSYSSKNNSFSFRPYLAFVASIVVLVVLGNFILGRTATPDVQGEYESMLIAELSRGIDLYDVMTSEEFEAETLSEEEIVEYLIATGVPVESFNFYVEDEKEH